MSLIDRAKRRFQRARERRGWLDHLALTIQHYLDAQGPANAGNITYFGFLSFFPLLAIGFAAIGIVSRAYPDARDSLVSALKDMFPVIIGDADGQVSIDTFETAAGTAGFLGVVALLFLGINWLSAVRAGLEHVFDLVPQETPNFFVGKLRDLLSLGAVGTVLIASVAISTTVTNFSAQVREDWDWTWCPAPASWSPGSASLWASRRARCSSWCCSGCSPTRTSRSARWCTAHCSRPSLRGAQAGRQQTARTVHAQPGGGGVRHRAGADRLVSYFARVTLLGASWAETSPITVAARAEAAQEEALAEAEKMLQIEWGPSASEDEETVDRPKEVVTIIRSAATFAAITLLLRRALRQ
jgi:membrane protein